MTNGKIKIAILTIPYNSSNGFPIAVSTNPKPTPAAAPGALAPAAAALPLAAGRTGEPGPRLDPCLARPEPLSLIHI